MLHSYQRLSREWRYSADAKCLNHGKMGSGKTPHCKPTLLWSRERKWATRYTNFEIRTIVQKKFISITTSTPPVEHDRPRLSWYQRVFQHGIGKRWLRPCQGRAQGSVWGHSKLQHEVRLRKFRHDERHEGGGQSHRGQDLVLGSLEQRPTHHKVCMPSFNISLKRCLQILFCNKAECWGSWEKERGKRPYWHSELSSHQTQTRNSWQGILAVWTTWGRQINHLPTHGKGEGLQVMVWIEIIKFILKLEIFSTH